MKRLVPLVLALLVVIGKPAAVAAAPAAPIITSPADGSVSCEPQVTFAGTSDPSVNVRIDEAGATLGSSTADAGGNWQVDTTLSAGDHSVAAVANDGSGDASSVPLNVTVLPTADSVFSGSLEATYAVISPSNGDGYRDSTTLGAKADRTGSIRFRIYKSSTLIRQSRAIAVTSGDSATWPWSGRDADGNVVSSGRYTAKAVWVGDGCTYSISRTITVDNIAPRVTSYSDSPNTFYPRENDDLTEYKDTTLVSWSGLDGRAHVWLYIYKDGGASPVRKLDDGWDDNGGRGSVRWDGRRSDGTLMPAGIYDYRLRLRDPYGNERFTGRGEVRVSHKRLDARSVTRQKDGEDYSNRGYSTCGGTSRPDSDWAQGVWLFIDNYYCDWYDEYDDFANVEYVFSVPSAAYYHSFKTSIYGNSKTDNTRLQAFHRDYVRNEWDYAGYVGGSKGTHGFGKLYGSEYVSGAGNARVGLQISDSNDIVEDYDIRDVSLRIVYGVLV